MNDAGSEYDRSRMQVFFQLWCPGSQEMSVLAILCRHCGYATYRPRPTANDLDSKYEFQKKTSPDQGTNRNRDACRLDQKRAWKVFTRLKPFLPHRRLRVLDYGGGDGRLMEPFSSHGHRCFIIDYNENPVPGVEHLGCTLEHLSENEEFDLIVSSHVLEHVAEPARVVRTLVSHLRPDGLLYVEVPDELFGGLPIEKDPVTHIGFFSRKSLVVLLQIAGLRVLRSRAQVGTYNERPLHILWCIGEKSASLSRPDFAGAAAEAMAALDPGALRRLGRSWNPHYVWGRGRQHFHYHHPARKFFRRLKRRVRERMALLSAPH